MTDCEVGVTARDSYMKLSKSMMFKLHEGLGIPYENMMELPAPRYRKVAMI